MRIATWNMQFRDGLSDERAQTFRTQMGHIGADVWVLTETWMSFSPGPDYVLRSASRWAGDLENAKDRHRADRRWVAIWCRLPARMLEVQSETERMACARIEQTDWPDVVVVGTVLPWHSNGGDAAFCLALHAQAPEWGRLWGSPRTCVFCLAGDFNQPLEGNQAGFSCDRRQALEATLRNLQMDCLTRDIPGQAGHSDRTIDHICLGGVNLPLVANPAGKWVAPTIEGCQNPISDHDCYYVDLHFSR